MAGAPAASVRLSDLISTSSALPLCRLYGAAIRPIEAIVALGGGSVMDAAKVLAAANGDFALLLETDRVAKPSVLHRSLRCRPPPAPAARSPAGPPSGTPGHWKSLAARAIASFRCRAWCIAADAGCGGLTISTGLDALSHALESSGRQRHLFLRRVGRDGRARSHRCAAAARRRRRRALRTRMARDSLAAGLAFSDTRRLWRTRSPTISRCFRRSARDRLLVQPADGHARAIGLRRRRDASASPHLGRRPRGRCCTLDALLRRLGVSRAPQITASPRGRQALIDDALSGDRGQNFIGRRECLIAGA